jgi:hypothetical protein
MTADTPEQVGTAFSNHGAFEPSDDGFRLTTTVFETVVATTEDGGDVTYTVTVEVPTLEAATAEEVGETLAESWAETLTRRLEEAPKSTRARLELDGFGLEEVGDALQIEYAFTWGNPTRAIEIAKTLAEYVEGTYVEGIVPGYDYKPPVSSLLADASHDGEGGTPL